MPDAFALLSLMLLTTCLALLFYALRLRAKVSELARESSKQRAAAVQASRAVRRDAETSLSEALDLVSDAVYLLERYAKDNPGEAEELEEVISALEDAEEALDRLVRERGNAGRRGVRAPSLPAWFNSGL